MGGESGPSISIAYGHVDGALLSLWEPLRLQRLVSRWGAPCPGP